MSKGRGSAIGAMATAIAVLCLVLIQFDGVHGASYTVGGLTGWTFNTANWPNGKRFKAGDMLVFNYDATTHNVVAVNRAGYNSCKAPARAKVLTTGSDKIKLVKGQNYFMCSVAGHCQSGMKIAITAA